MSAKFGPAGNSISFTKMGYKHSLQVPEYLEKMGLNAFEYQCGRGVNIGLDKATALGEKAREKGITLSLHAPYYISMSSVEEEKRLNSINYILSSARAVNAMGGNRIVVHTGSCGKITREYALELAIDTMKKALDALDNENLGHIHICPETMGKVNQLGTLDEVMALCTIDERLIPCIDFGHLNARDLGCFKTISDYETVFKTIENRLGNDRLKTFHSHFSKIEYTTGGEKKHLTFADTVYGPDFEPVMELTAKYGCSPTFICESDGTQAEDAAAMRKYYNGIC
ncbi:MAG: TIM barrel protein [Clostridia bacterium]|nr:TIM barrel protein [Clostridia bacterium]MEE0807891.1 TIM barrel protein [Acutalibacteraceae bacterium]